MARHVLLTGATDGIGLAMARRLEAEGAVLTLVGRRPLEALDEVLFTPTTYCRADLSLPDAASRVVTFLEDQGRPPIDLLVHNAGVGWYGAAEAEDAARIRTTLDVNLWAPVALTHALLPHLAEPTATIVFVSSVLADLPAPEIACYAASKAALDGFARSLRVELAGRARVVAVHPGGTATAMHEKAGVPAAQRERFRFPSADRVAARILRHAERGRRAPTVGAGNAVARFLGRHATGPLDWAMRRGRK
ncbi:MAG: SDR family NAD(P)-dependent oxidoreductase [Planctomycetota bacterium]|nr:SDR family NAD(P)-dependent oxidoreductase [Planctomycetota bacterium]